MRATPDVARATPTPARRRRDRRMISFFRHERMTVQTAVISAQHHSAQRSCSVATQTYDEVPAATASPAATFAATPASAPVATHAAPAPVFEYVAPAPVMENIAPVPAVIFDAPSQELPPVYTKATVATDVNLDVTGLVSPLSHFLPLMSLLRLCTTKSIRNRSLQGRRPQTLWTSQLCKNR